MYIKGQITSVGIALSPGPFSGSPICTPVDAKWISDLLRPRGYCIIASTWSGAGVRVQGSAYRCLVNRMRGNLKDVTCLLVVKRDRHTDSH